MKFPPQARDKLSYLVAVGWQLPGCGRTVCGRVRGMKKRGKGRGRDYCLSSTPPQQMAQGGGFSRFFGVSGPEFANDPLAFYVLGAELVNGTAVD